MKNEIELPIVIIRLSLWLSHTRVIATNLWHTRVISYLWHARLNTIAMEHNPLTNPLSVCPIVLLLVDIKALVTSYSIYWLIYLYSPTLLHALTKIKYNLHNILDFLICNGYWYYWYILTYVLHKLHYIIIIIYL